MVTKHYKTFITYLNPKFPSNLFKNGAKEEKAFGTATIRWNRSSYNGEVYT